MTKQKITVESLSAAILIWWGISVANPLTETFEIVGNLFDPMRAVAPEIFWGLFYFALGAVSMACFIKERIRETEVINFIGLASLAALFLVGEYRSYAWGVYMLPAIANFIFWRERRWKSLKHSNG